MFVLNFLRYPRINPVRKHWRRLKCDIFSRSSRIFRHRWHGVWTVVTWFTVKRVFASCVSAQYDSTFGKHLNTSLRSDRRENREQCVVQTRLCLKRQLVWCSGSLKERGNVFLEYAKKHTGTQNRNKITRAHVGPICAQLQSQHELC